MRIIKEGKKQVKEIIMTCRRCGCEFAYDRGDVLFDQREGNWVVCPTCKAYLGVGSFPTY